jgi:tight adherence protein B
MMAYYVVITVVFAACFAAGMAYFSARAGRAERASELRRRLGASEEGLFSFEDNRIENWLGEAGVVMGYREFTTRVLLAGAAGLLIGGIIGDLMNVVVFGATGFAILPMWVMSKRSARLARCDEQFPQALQLMILSLRAGHALPGALALAARESPVPLCDELRRAVDEQSLGRPMAQVIERLSARLPGCSAANVLATAVAVLEQTGGNLIYVMDRIVNSARARTQYRAKLRAMTSQGRVSAYIVCAMPFLFGIMVSFLDPKYVPAVKAHPMLIALFFGLWIPGMLWTTKLVRQAAAV